MMQRLVSVSLRALERGTLDATTGHNAAVGHGGFHTAFSTLYGSCDRRVRVQPSPCYVLCGWRLCLHFPRELAAHCSRARGLGRHAHKFHPQWQACRRAVTIARCLGVQPVLLQAQQIRYFCVVQNWDGARMEEFVGELPPGDESLSDFLEYARPSPTSDDASAKARQWRFAVVPGPQAPPAFVQLFVEHVESGLQQLGNTQLMVLPGPPGTNSTADIALHDGQVFWSLAVANSGNINVATLLLHMLIIMHFIIGSERPGLIMMSMILTCCAHWLCTAAMNVT